MRSCYKCGAPCLDTHRYCPACGADLAARAAEMEDDGDPLVGATINGTFLIHELLGTGGMGKVYRAEQRGVGRSVAVKIMHQHLLGDETAAARFTNEARASSSLNHPNSISVMDFGQTESGLLFIVMEYLHGLPLDQLLHEQYPLQLWRVVDILCQSLDAVQAAHHKNIIHRDLKPENVFVIERSSGRDFVKVLDFGIAKMLDLEDRSVTTPGLVPGTPEYMSPEQARGEPLDPRSDVYSMGVILYELLTYTVPFRGAAPIQTMMSHVQDPVEPPSKRCPEMNVPAALEAIVLWALAKDPADRISSAEQFRDLLAAWADVAGIWSDTEAEPKGSSPDVLLDFFSEEQLTQIPEDVQPEQRLATSGFALAERTNKITTFEPSDRLIGRDGELKQLRDFVERSQPRSLRIEGAVGLGKSRLVDELISMANTPVSRTAPERNHFPSALALAQQLALELLGVPRGSGATEIIDAAKALGLPDEELPGLRELFALPSDLSNAPEASRRRERDTAFRELVYLSARNEARLFVFEEIDSYDQASRELLMGLAASPREGMAVVLIHQPRPGASWPGQIEVLDLAPLGPEHSIELAAAMLGEEGKGHADSIAKTAQGFPLYIQQAAYAVVYDGLTDLPTGIADLVADRVGQLPYDQRFALQWLAALNRNATSETLARLCGQPVSESDLDALVQSGFLYRAGDEVVFAHHMIKMVAYSSIPAEVRREMHLQIARYLRSQGDAPIATIAHHSSQADEGPVAVGELDKAGERAAQCLDVQGAIAAYTQALNLIRREWGRGRVDAFELDRLAVAIALRLATVLHSTGDKMTASGVIEEIISTAGGAPESRARLRVKLAEMSISAGELKKAARNLELARNDVDANRAKVTYAEILDKLAGVRARLGERRQARELLSEAIQVQKTMPDARSNSLLSLARSAALTPDADLASELLKRAMEQTKQERDLSGMAGALSQLADLQRKLGDPDSAVALFEQAVDLCQRVGDRSTMVEILIQMARLRRTAGDSAGARKLLTRASDLGKRISWWEGQRQVEQEIQLLT